MHRPSIVRLAVALVLGLSGCTSKPAASPPPPATVAVAIRTAGNIVPTAQQLAGIQHTVQGHLSRAGYQFAPDPRVADFLLTVTFTPDAVDPRSGHLTFNGLEPVRPSHRGVPVTYEDPTVVEMRRRLREIDAWVEAQSRPTS